MLVPVVDCGGVGPIVTVMVDKLHMKQIKDPEFQTMWANAFHRQFKVSAMHLSFCFITQGKLNGWHDPVQLQISAFVVTFFI